MSVDVFWSRTLRKRTLQVCNSNTGPTSKGSKRNVHLLVRNEKKNNSLGFRGFSGGILVSYGTVPCKLCGT